MMPTHTHRHRPAHSVDRPYSGPVASPENPAAHGNIVRIDTCRCGAQRRSNINQTHVERGPWVTDSTMEEY